MNETMTTPAPACAGTPLTSLTVTLLAAALLCGVAGAQDEPPVDTVQWTPAAPAAVKQGAHVRLEVKGAVKEGWHVYGLKQEPLGPTPLKVTVDAGSVARADGAPSGSKPQIVHDPRFDVDTPLYSHDFSLTVPVRLSEHLPAGRALIPVSVRFQSCSDRECLPPRTVHLQVPVNVRADG